VRLREGLVERGADDRARRHLPEDGGVSRTEKVFDQIVPILSLFFGDFCIAIAREINKIGHSFPCGIVEAIVIHTSSAAGVS
jgi:hypothetical protein